MRKNAMISLIVILAVTISNSSMAFASSKLVDDLMGIITIDNVIRNGVYVGDATGVENRAKDYMNINSGMSYDEALWKVKANVDKAEFSGEEIVSAEEFNSITVLVNKKNKVLVNYVPADLVNLTDLVSLRKEAKEAFDALSAAANGQGLKIVPNSGFRSVEYQESLYKGYLRSDSLANVETYSARPWYSEHHTGLALDVQGSYGGMLGFGNTKEFRWVKEYGHIYGYIVRYTEENKKITGYKSEPWHIRYVGVNVATQMKIESITSLEEYVGKYVR